MRRLVWGSVAVCLIAGGFAAYRAVNPEPTAPADWSTVEEEEEWTAPTEPAQSQGPIADRETADAVEPILVEGAATDPPPAPQFGGAVLPGSSLTIIALGPDQPPRPDEEPGEEKQMPYAEDYGSITQLWEALGRLLAGEPRLRVSGSPHADR
jgi:hypothetical protein